MIYNIISEWFFNNYIC